MRWSVRVRRVSARHPWLRWTFVSGVAALVAFTVHGRLGGLDERRSQWGELRPVLVARRALAPGDRVSPAEARLEERPVALVPDDALTGLDEVRQGTTTWQWVAAGEVLVTHDLRSTASSSTRLPGGTRGVVVGASGLPAGPGDAVDVVIDGTIAASGLVIDRLDGAGERLASLSATSLLVAVPERMAGRVAAAAAEGRATVVLGAPDDPFSASRRS